MKFHNWSTYFDTQIDENLVTLGELLVTTDGIVAPSIPLDSAFNLADVNTMMAPYIAKYSGVESGVAALGTNHGIGGSWGPKAAFDPKSNRIYPSIVWNFGGGGTAMSYDFTIQKARQLNNFVANSDFYQSSEINLYVPAP